MEMDPANSEIVGGFDAEPKVAGSFAAMEPCECDVCPS
jgi:hypothetical protein